MGLKALDSKVGVLEDTRWRSDGSGVFSVCVCV